MEGNVVLKYSKDGGATWSTATTVAVSRCHAWIRPETESEQNEVMGDYDICYRATPRLVLSFQLDMNQFDPVKNPSTADSLWVFINKLRAAPLIHLYYAGTSIDGFTEFAATPNTNYLVPADTPDPEYIATDGTRFRAMNFTLQLRKAVAL